MLRRPNAAPVQAEHAGGQATRVRRGRPEKPARSEYSRDFLNEPAGVQKVLQIFPRREDVESLRRIRSLVKFAFQNFKTQLTHLLCPMRIHLKPPAPAIRGCARL